MSKLEQLFPYSNPSIVYERARKLYGRDVKIQYSNRKDKKYMMYNPNTREWIHFGQIGIKDYTKTGDEIRRLKYQMVNHKYASSPKYSASFNTYFLLW